ncbi:hypothetical protein GCK32_022912, partial [Trichostrongylus colubriformis]
VRKLSWSTEPASGLAGKFTMVAELQPNHSVNSGRTRLPAELTGPGWKARGDRIPTDKRVPFNRPTAKQVG